MAFGLDAAGNRTSRTVNGTLQYSYAWDALNRMEGVDSASGYDSGYQYRADGLRAAQLRQAAGSAQRVTSYRYDGQMPVEEVYEVHAPGGTTTETTRWAVGPRGTERQEFVDSAGTDVSFPLYDIHGNAFAHVRRNPNSPLDHIPLTAGDVRSYDPWGNVTSSAYYAAGAQGGSKQAYGGSLGHRKDDETGLVYMRARYYDPQVGRFTSEDMAYDGYNWFAYCKNDPVNAADANGNSAEAIMFLLNKAFDLLMNNGWGSGSVSTRVLLEEIVERLKEIGNIGEVEGRALLLEGAEDKNKAAFMGSASELQMKIGEIKQAIGTIGMTDGVLSKMAIRTVGIMMEILKSQNGTHWDIP